MKSAENSSETKEWRIKHISFRDPYAMITHCHSLLVVLFIMTLNFVFFIIPSLDRYLEKKYQDEFRDYVRKTEKPIPMVY